MNQQQAIQNLQDVLQLDIADATKLVEKAIEGGETNGDDLEPWITTRFLPNCVTIDRDGYCRMCIDVSKNSKYNRLRRIMAVRVKETLDNFGRT